LLRRLIVCFRAKMRKPAGDWNVTLSTANSPRSADFAIFVLPHIEGANLGIATTAICSQ